MTAKDDSKPYGIIYCATNKVNGKRYVGQTTSTLKRRWGAHCRPNSGCKSVSGAIQKYGKDSFDIVEIDSAKTLDELNAKELFYIASFGTDKQGFGYNIRPGGNSSKQAESSKKLMSAAKLGFKMPEGTRLKISLALKGMAKTAEHGANVSLAKKGRKNSAEHIKNMSKPRPDYRMSDEHKEAIRAAATGRIFSTEKDFSRQQRPHQRPAKR
jgi:group I intron endonuclease